MNHLPAEIRVKLPPAGACAAIDVEFKAVAVEAGALLNIVESSVRLFQSSVRLGMYSTAFASNAADAPGFDIVRADVSAPGAFRQRWRVRGFDYNALRIFINLAQVINFRQVPLAVVSLEAETMAAEKVIDESMLLSAPYPHRAGILPFPVRILQQLAGKKGACIRMDLASGIDEPRLAVFETALSTWDRLVMRGGYGGDLAELELDESTTLAETYMTAPDMLEHMLHVNIPLTQAFDALFNMLAWLHMTTCALTAVEVE